MKFLEVKILKAVGVLSATFCLSQGFAWGPVGHKTTALIAEAYLTPQTRAAVEDLLDGQRLVDAVNWADSLRGQAEYSHTLPYHYQNMPNIEGDVLRKNQNAYKKGIEGLDPNGNYNPGVVEAILAAQKNLQNPNVTRDEKQSSLKFLIHFIGDLHQPLHTGRAENRGGNSIALKWRSKDTNLHRVWDSDIIMERLAPNMTQGGPDISVVYGRELMTKFEAAAIPKERLENVSGWYNESMALQDTAYDDKYLKDQDSYYGKASPTIDARVFLAGRRMADTLNKLFEKQQIDAPNVQMVKILERTLGALEDLVSFRSAPK
ncbi:MAG: S1/P1 nuclease [Bdellovibrionales bacterium]|nr:S1/P1 nuclease [Bdellovibrionales bacterium]